MNPPLELKDSDFFEKQEESGSWRDRAHSLTFVKAVDELQRQFNDGTLDIICLRPYNVRGLVECPVSYERRFIESGEEYRFSTSHYIGRYSNDECTIIINPRFGKIFEYLISYATNLYLPYGSSDISCNTRNNSYWLIALLWKAMLNRALTTGQVPREYQTVTRNLSHYKGHLAIGKHIHANLCNATRFYCSYKKFSMDNTINRTIRAVYDILKNKGASPVVSEFEAYDKYLCSMGVRSDIDDISSIDCIRYTRMNAPYQPVMNLSRTILENYKAESSVDSGAKRNISYFVDIADLWEMYLLELLQNNLPVEYHVYSPNTGFGDCLLENRMRNIRPDIIIERDNRVVMIIDAKYKNYYRFGETANPGIQREDLYQMSTYLYHYSRGDGAIIGIFTSPVSCQDNEVYTYSNNRNHRIGLVNINIVGVENDIDLLHEYENEYITKIKCLLDGL